jgi:hypothetical protein
MFNRKNQRIIAAIICGIIILAMVVSLLATF